MASISWGGGGGEGGRGGEGEQGIKRSIAIYTLLEPYQFPVY